MALEIWPEALNNLAQRGSFTHKPGDPTVRTDFDSGPSRVRQRYTSAPNIYQFQVLMDSLEKLVFDGFFENIIHFGADWFTMPVVVAGDYLDANVRITKDGVSWNDNGYDNWTLSLTIEIRDLPSLDSASAYIIGNYGYRPSAFDPIQVPINDTYKHAWNAIVNLS